jgi:DNA modification methylase
MSRTITLYDDFDTSARLVVGDCVDVMTTMTAASVDAIVTDPPYGLEFMGKEWDKLGGDAGMVKTGIGERAIEWPAYGGDPHGGANPTCATCGGRKRGKKTCGCKVPDWRVKGKKVKPHNSGAAQQAWHARWAREAFRVLKPGGHLVAFGGTRTYHRLVCALEDAGFEIRDSLHWMYGSGFPKSLNVGKAIDKAAGAERKVVGMSTTKSGIADGNLGPQSRGTDHAWSKGNAVAVHVPITTPATPEAATWEGWGTALKPAHEIAPLFQKPWTAAALLDTMGSCLLSLSAATAATSSPSSPSVETLRSSAECRVGGRHSTPVDSSVATATSPFAKGVATSLNTVSSWQSTLDDLSRLLSTSTTETETALTTDLKILKSCLSEITPENIIQAATSPDGWTAPVSNAVTAFAAVASKWRATLTLSALDLATSPGPQEHRDGDVEPAHEPCVLARKPLIGTVAKNVLAHGTGALNIDGCRVGGGVARKIDNYPSKGAEGCMSHGHGGGSGHAGRVYETRETTQGRWPPNILLTHSAACCVVGTRQVRGDDRKSAVGAGRDGGGFADVGAHRADAQPGGPVYGSGVELSYACASDCPVAALDDPARFYPQLNWSPEYDAPFLYNAKAAKKEREAGCEHLGAQQQDTTRQEGNPGGDNPRNRGVHKRKNHHPCVKPIALMRWLVRLVTPPGGLVLDPFAGSGTTLIACAMEGVDSVGIEMNDAYVDIAEARVEHWQEQP